MGRGENSVSAAPADPPLTVAAVARRLGVAPGTLRTWDRRYGLGPSAHAAGAHRRYTSNDVERLLAMRRLTLNGVAPADAARTALTDGGRAVPTREPLPDQQGRPSLRRRGGPGGRVLALPGADAAVRGLGRAAMALDAGAATEAIRGQVERHGVVHTWECVLRPLLVAIGARWEATGEGVEVEHLLSECVTAVLHEAAARRREPLIGRPVLLACAADEQHVLPLHALSAALGERGVASRTLGAALPPKALHAAVRRTGPAVLFVWSHLASTADAAVLEQLPAARPATAVLVGGSGWRDVRLPERVAVVADLPQAVDAIAHAAGG